MTIPLSSGGASARRRKGEGERKRGANAVAALPRRRDYVEEGPLLEGLDSFELVELSLFEPVESLEPDPLLSPEPLPEPSRAGCLSLGSLDSSEPPLLRLPARLSVR